jgi:hypothetical protein
LFSGRKAQSVIIQFMLFFMIGFGIFIGVGMMFRARTDMFRDDTLMSSLKLADSYLTSIAITSLGCRECDIVESRVSIGSLSVGYYREIFLSSNGIRVATAPPFKEFNSSMHNINYTFQLDGVAPSVKTINLTFSRTQNKIEISQSG